MISMCYYKSICLNKRLLLVKFSLTIVFLLVLCSCSKDPSAEERIDAYEKSLYASSKVKLRESLEKNPLYNRGVSEISIQWDKIKKYCRKPPQIYVFDKIPKEIENFVVLGMELFVKLTQNINSSQKLKEVKLLSRALPPENAYGRYQSIFKKSREGNHTMVDIDYTPRYKFSDRLIDKAFYRNLRNRIDHLQSTNLYQTYQHLEKQINHYVQESQKKLEFHSSSKKKATIKSTLSWINAYTKPFLQDLKVLENRFTLISNRKYKQELWDNFIESKGKELDEYVASRAIEKFVLTENSPTTFNCQKNKKVLIRFTLKQWSLYFNDSPNPIIQVTQNNQESSNYEGQITLSELRLLVTEKVVLGGHRFQSFDNDFKEYYQAPTVYYLVTRDQGSGYSFKFECNESLFQNITVGELLSEASYSELFSVPEIPMEKELKGFRKF